MSSAPESSPRRGLGRGLEVLIGGTPAPSELLEIPVDAIHPNPKQPRRRFEAEAASGLADSVRKQGIIQPLLVRPRGIGGYEIVAGERRWRAAREAGRETVPAVVRAVDDRDTLLLGLVENVAREQLTAGRGVARVRRPHRRVRPLARRRRRARRPLEAVRLEPDPPARVARRRARDGRARPAERGPRARRSRRARPRRPPPPRARDRKRGLSVRAAEQRAKWAGAKQRPRTRSARSTRTSPRASRRRSSSSPATARESRPAASRSRSPTSTTSRRSPSALESSAPPV